MHLIILKFFLFRLFFLMLLRCLEGAVLGRYDPPEVLLPLSVIPERLTRGKVVEGGGRKYLAFSLLKFAFCVAKLLTFM